jgi:hypothetical protein
MRAGRNSEPFVENRRILLDENAFYRVTSQSP